MSLELEGELAARLVELTVSAAAGIRQAVLVMDRLSEVWDGLQPVVMVIREFNKRLDPHRIASGTGDVSLRSIHFQPLLFTSPLTRLSPSFRSLKLPIRFRIRISVWRSKTDLADP